jgi:hypothetical protein
MRKYDYEDPGRYLIVGGVEAPRKNNERFRPLLPGRASALERKWQRMQEVPRTYLIGAEHTHLVKIGHTTLDPQRRLAALQTGQPMTLSLLWSTTGKYERELHRRFAAYRVRGEWFDLTSFGDPVETVQRAVHEMGGESPRLVAADHGQR